MFQNRFSIAVTSLVLASGLFSAPNRTVAADAPVSHWLLQPEAVDHLTIKDTTGSQSGHINGLVRFWHGKNVAALTFDGLHTAIVSPPPEALLSPAALTVSAWVTIDKPVSQGGIAGLIQKEKPYAAGWLLGYRDDRFAFSVPTEGAAGDPLLSRTQFQRGRWYHVAGTFDGKTVQLFVNGQLEASVETASAKVVTPPGAEFVIGALRDGERIDSLSGMIHEVTIHSRALDGSELTSQFDEKSAAFPAPSEVTVGPHVEFTSRDAAVVRWQTAQPTPSIVAYGTDKKLTERAADMQETTQHQVTLQPLEPDVIYSFQIRGGGDFTADKTHDFDTHFNYTLPDIAEAPSPYPQDELTAVYESFAERVLKETGVTKGYCLVLGAEQGRLAYELAKRSDLKIVAVDENPKNVAATRAALGDTPYYGLRISVHQGSLSDLPYGEYLANLIVSDSMLVHGRLDADPAEVYRVLRPSGGVAYFGQTEAKPATVTAESLKKWLSQDPNDESTVTQDGGAFALVRRGALAGAGQWTHQYGLADNASCSEDFLVRGAMNVQWWGRPGPRPMPDRGPRNPAPLSAGGRLYIQGDRILFGLDAYNGTVLWSQQVPVVRRANMPRDCSNMVAAEDALYVVEGDHVLKFDGQTGTLQRTIEIPGAAEKEPSDWGYLGCVGDTLLGSSMKPGAAYLGDFGEWYDKNEPTAIAKVTSRELFALDRHNGSPRWNYRGGVIINATLAVADGRVYFVESRNPDALNAKEGRLVDEVRSGQFIVALDLQTGEKLWEQPTDLSDALRVIYLVISDDTLVVTGSSQEKYHMWAFNAEDGKPLWQDAFAMKKEDHGGAIQHPVAVGGTLYCELRGYNLRSGKLERTDLPQRRGCGTMAASNYAFFYRHRFHGMWDLETNTQSEFQGIRGGCWLGQIPAGGLMLAPETSAGCSCTHSIQISVGYIPAAMTKQKPPQK